tara:strand:- start:709 stop:909 length:201 start_codon:yes stop_codon:yes gene_type:complete
MPTEREMMYKIFDTTKEDVEKMNWDEIRELLGFMIRNDLYEMFCEHIGGPPHVIRHNVELEKMRNK